MNEIWLGPLLNDNRALLIERCAKLVANNQSDAFIYLAASYPLLELVTQRFSTATAIAAFGVNFPSIFSAALSGACCIRRLTKTATVAAAHSDRSRRVAAEAQLDFASAASVAGGKPTESTRATRHSRRMREQCRDTDRRDPTRRANSRRTDRNPHRREPATSKKELDRTARHHADRFRQRDLAHLFHLHRTAESEPIH